MVSTPAMKYNPAFLTEDELVRSFVVRQKDLEFILEVIRENGAKNNQHVLVVAPRGAGKTTLVLRIASEIRKNRQFSEKWYPVVFSEESYEVCTPGEFWLEALFHIGEQTRDMRWKKAYADLRTEKDEKRLRERALSQLMDFADERNRRLLLVVENLNMLLGQQISQDDSWKIRHTLLNEPRIMLLGTAISRFDQLDNSEHAMFELFRFHHLDPLDTDQCGELWESITGQKLGWNRIRPIEILTGGSPRLLVIISGFVVKSSFRELMENLTKLVDEHTEYFKSHLDNLPPQERKVFVTLADMWNPVTARDIAESCRISVNKVSAHLQRLLSKGAVVVADQKGRKKWYQVAERMYNIYHLMRRRGKASDRVRGVVDFAIHFYRDDDLVELTKTIAQEACNLSPVSCQDHFRFIEEIIKTPQTEKYRQRIIEKLPDKVIASLEIPEPFFKSISTERPEAETMPEKISKEEIATELSKELQDPVYLTELVKDILQNHPDRIEEAVAACKKAMAIDPQHVTALSLYGSIMLFETENFGEAEKTFKHAIEIDPEYMPAWMGLAFLYDSKPERHEEAEKAYRKVLEIDPENATAWRNLGNLLSDVPERHEEAEKAYRKALEIDPENAEAWGNLGNLLCYKLERHEEAEKAYRKALEIDPENAEAWGNLGILLSYVMKRHEEAEKAYRKALEFDSENFKTWVNLGNLLSCVTERYGEAEKAYRRAIEIEQNIFACWANFAKFLKDQTRYIEAEHAYEKATELEPDLFLIWRSLIELQLEYLKDPLKAIRTAERYVEVSHRTAQSLNNLAWFFFEEKYKEYFPTAEAWCREAIDKEKDVPTYHHTLAAIIGGMGKWNESLEVSRQYIGNDTYVEDEIGEITEYFINAAAAGHAKKAIGIIEEHSDIPSLEPIIAGLKIFLGEKILTAQEIREIGRDVAARIREKVKT